MVVHESQREGVPVYGDGVSKVTKQILVGPRDGFEGYLREFTLEPGGHTPYHHHDWYHVVYILEGSGNVRVEGRDHPVGQGSVVHAEAGKHHGFTNTGDGRFRFLCLVPTAGDRYAEER